MSIRLVRALAILAGIALAITSLASCGVKPDGSNGIRRDFVVSKIPLEQTYRRAVDFARECHSGGGIFKHATVTNEIYDDTGEAFVHIAWGGGSMPEQINLKRDSSGTLISVVSVGGGIFDQKELDAAQRSITSGTVSCR